SLTLPAAARAWLALTNPPWGRRLHALDVSETWSALGTWVRGQLCGGTLAVLSGEPTLTRSLGLKAQRRWPVHIGAVDARWCVYSIRNA
ncbi:MAG: hypothetical protein JSV80_11880, partial [Acidobacteriota bacterium]